MGKIAILSDIHAGLGKNDAPLRALQTASIKNTADFLKNQDVDALILNGDTTDHLLNSLSGDTDADVARESLRPIVDILQERRGNLQTIVIAGNTDWPIADPDPKVREAFFDYTGIPQSLASIPQGGLVHIEENDDIQLVVTHGHALKPAQWGHEGPMTDEDYAGLWESIQHPTPEFLHAISAVSGSHREDFLKAERAGKLIKRLPAPLRKLASHLAGKLKMTPEYEPHFANMIKGAMSSASKKVIGIMGHTHFSGIRKYGDQTILNTGTTGAKPNPLQRIADPVANIALMDTESDEYSLVQTYDAARPSKKAMEIANGRLSKM